MSAILGTSCGLMIAPLSPHSECSQARCGSYCDWPLNPPDYVLLVLTPSGAEGGWVEAECSPEPDLTRVVATESGLGVRGTEPEVRFSSQAFQRELETGYQAWETKTRYPDRAQTRCQETLGCWTRADALEIAVPSELKGGMADAIQRCLLAWAQLVGETHDLGYM